MEDDNMKASVDHPFLRGGSPVIVAARRLGVVKGFDIVLRALSLVLKER